MGVLQCQNGSVRTRCAIAPLRIGDQAETGTHRSQVKRYGAETPINSTSAICILLAAEGSRTVGNSTWKYV